MTAQLLQPVMAFNVLGDDEAANFLSWADGQCARLGNERSAGFFNGTIHAAELSIYGSPFSKRPVEKGE